MTLHTDPRLISAIIRTLSYSAIFSHAPTVKELHTWLIAPLPAIPTYQQIIQTIKANKHLQIKRKRVLLPDTQLSPIESEQRSHYFHTKLKSLKFITRIFSLIPTIQLVAITGSVAAHAPKQDDDIDLLIVAKSGHLWTTRFLAIIIAEILFVRRRPRSQHNNNKICLNLFLDYSSLKLPPSRQDLYTARELLQIIPLVNKHQTYETLIYQNQWALQFFPVASKASFNWLSRFFPSDHLPASSSLFEKLFWFIQQKYMSRHQTKEHTTTNSAYFHPFDYREYVMGQYNRNITLYNKLCRHELNSTHKKFTRKSQPKTHPQRP